MDHKKLHEDHDLKPHDLLRNYSEHSYKINDQLFDHYVHGIEPSDKDHIETLDELIDVPAKYNFTVYSGIKWNPEDYWEKLSVAVDHEITMHLPAFTSTSSDINIAFKFSRFLNGISEQRKIQFSSKPIQRAYFLDEDTDYLHVLKIQIPAGVKLGSLLSQSKHKNEKEIVVKRGVNIIIHPEVELIRDEDGNFVFVWDAEIAQ